MAQGKTGGYFSRNYLWDGSFLADDKKTRFRVAAFLSDYFGVSSGEAGKYIELELGIKCRILGSSRYYVNWVALFEKINKVEFLDTVTALIKYEYDHSTPDIRNSSRKHPLRDFVLRSFSENKLAYIIDDQGGIHPLVDAKFQSMAGSLIRNLSESDLSAAKHYVEAAELSLLQSHFDGRGGIRAIFDAAENMLKQIAPRATQLNTNAISEQLLPVLIAIVGPDLIEQRAVRKLVASFSDWVDAAHFYRHEPGSQEPVQPSEIFTTVMVSQGMGFVRWLADALKHRRVTPSQA